MKKAILCLFVAMLLCPLTIHAQEDQDEDQNGKDSEDINEIVSDVPVNKEVSGSIFGSIYGIDDDLVMNVSTTARKGGNAEDEAFYEWTEDVRKLTIFKALFLKAQQTKKNIVMRILDNEDHKMEYRVRIFYKDIKDKEAEDMEIEFGAKCEHKDFIKNLLIGAEARVILSCKQKKIDFPVYIGVAVPKKWDHGYGVYHYAYQSDQKGLELLRNDLKIDEENIVEIPLKPGTDHVFYNHVLPVEEKNLLTWVKGLSNGSPSIHGGNAMKAVVAFTLGVLLIAGNAVLFLRHKRLNHADGASKKYSYDK